MKLSKRRTLKDDHYKLLKKLPLGVLLTPKREDKLRASSLPYCQLHMALTNLELIKEGRANPTDLLEKELVEFKSAFYFAIGNGLHTLWQDAGTHLLPRQLLGDWECSRTLSVNETDATVTIKKCGYKADFCTQAKAADHICPHGKSNCSEHLKYREIALKYKNLGGHPDFILKVRGKRGWVDIFDIKTTSAFLFEKGDEVTSRYYPSKKYIEQLQAYAWLLERQKKVRVRSFTIVYIGRNGAINNKTGRPIMKLYTFKYNSKLRRLVKAKVLDYNQRWQRYQAWFAAYQAKSAKQYKTASEELYKTRPCQSRKFYLENMAHGFFDPCPYYESGSCFNGKSLKLLLKGKL